MKIWMLQHYREGDYTKEKFFREDNPPSIETILEIAEEWGVGRKQLGHIRESFLYGSSWEGYYEQIELTLKNVM